MARQYEVTIPIAGHAIVDVVADSEEEAIEKAMNEVSAKHPESWEALNIYYCPTPWEAEAVDLGEAEDAEPAQ